MAEYIEKQAAIDNIEKSFDKETILNRFVRKIAISAVRRMEPADVRPVVRGRWVVKNSDGSWRVDVCSCCKKEMHYINYAPAYDYCPNCGADMRGTQDE